MTANHNFGGMMKASGWRWGLVTFSLGISSGVLGHYLPGEVAYFGIILLSALFAVFGGLCVGGE